MTAQVTAQGQESMSQRQVSDPAAERYVLGSILLDSQSYYLAAGYLSEGCFYTPMHRDIFRAIHSLSGEGKQMDIVLVNAELARMGVTSVTMLDLMDIMAGVASSAHIEEHALRLRTLYRRRKLWEIAQRLSSESMDESKDIDRAQQKAIDGMLDASEETQKDVTICGALGELVQAVDENQRRGYRMTGTPTGFTKWDEKGGLQGGDLVVIAADSSMGKTSLALTMARNAVERGRGVAFYSMEMTRQQLTARYISPLVRIPSSRLLYATNLTASETGRIKAVSGKHMEDGFYIDDASTSSLDSILVSIRTMKARYGIKGAVIDYLQILGIVGGSGRVTREQMLGSAARRLKNLAKELGIWVIALSQLSRDKEKGLPSLARIRDSGQIVEAADVVALLYRPDAAGEKSYGSMMGGDVPSPVDGTAMIDVAKGRNIGTFRFFARFDGATTTFHDMSEPLQAPEQQLPFPMAGEPLPY